MKNLKRIAAIWLTAMLFVSTLAIAPAGASDDAPVPVTPEQVLEGEIPPLTAEEIEGYLEELREEYLDDLPSEDATDRIINNALEAQPDLVQLDEIVPSDVQIVGGELQAELGSGADAIQIVRRIGNGTRNRDIDRGARSKVTDGDTEVVVETTGSSLRIMEVIGARNEQHRFRYSVRVDGQNAYLTLNEDGSVSVSDREMEFGDEGFTLYGVIEAPWAVDNNGNEIDVSYTVSRNGRTLRMIVDKAPRSAYPVVADPTVTTRYGKLHCFWNCSFYFDGVATRYLRRDVLGHETDYRMAQIAAGLLCAGLTGAAGPAGAIAGVFCSVYLGAHIDGIRDNLLAAPTNSGNNCLIAKFHPARITSTLHWRNVSTSGSQYCSYNL